MSASSSLMPPPGWPLPTVKTEITDRGADLSSPSGFIGAARRDELDDLRSLDHRQIPSRYHPSRVALGPAQRKVGGRCYSD